MPKQVTRPPIKRVQLFRNLLRKCFDENNRPESLGLPVVRAFVAEAEKESPFSDAELDACIKEMADINVLMRSEDIIYLIESGK